MMAFSISGFSSNSKSISKSPQLGCWALINGRWKSHTSCPNQRESLCLFSNIYPPLFSLFLYSTFSPPLFIRQHSRLRSWFNSLKATSSWWPRSACSLFLRLRSHHDQSHWVCWNQHAYITTWVSYFFSIFHIWLRVSHLRVFLCTLVYSFLLLCFLCYLPCFLSCPQHASCNPTHISYFCKVYITTWWVYACLGSFFTLL